MKPRKRKRERPTVRLVDELRCQLHEAKVSRAGALQRQIERAERAEAELEKERVFIRRMCQGAVSVFAEVSKRMEREERFG